MTPDVCMYIQIEKKNTSNPIRQNEKDKSAPQRCSPVDDKYADAPEHTWTIRASVRRNWVHAVIAKKKKWLTPRPWNESRAVSYAWDYDWEILEICNVDWTLCPRTYAISRVLYIIMFESFELLLTNGKIVDFQADFIKIKLYDSFIQMMKKKKVVQKW